MFRLWTGLVVCAPAFEKSKFKLFIIITLFKRQISADCISAFYIPVSEVQWLKRAAMRAMTLMTLKTSFSCNKIYILKPSLWIWFKAHLTNVRCSSWMTYSETASHCLLAQAPAGFDFHYFEGLGHAENEWYYYKWRRLWREFKLSRSRNTAW